MSPREFYRMCDFVGQLVSYDVVDATTSSCPVELVKVPVPDNDSEFRANSSSAPKSSFPFHRSVYNPDTGNAPNRPRQPVGQLFDDPRHNAALLAPFRNSEQQLNLRWECAAITEAVFSYTVVLPVTDRKHGVMWSAPNGGDADLVVP